MADATQFEVVLGNDTITLQAPKSLALRMAICAAAGANNLRACIAALAMCWRSPGRPKTQIRAARYNVAEFGGLVAEELAERGYTVSDLYVAGAHAFRLCCEGLVTGDEVDEAENFTEDQAAT